MTANYMLPSRKEVTTTQLNSRHCLICRLLPLITSSIARAQPQPYPMTQPALCITCEMSDGDFIPCGLSHVLYIIFCEMPHFLCVTCKLSLSLGKKNWFSFYHLQNDQKKCAMHHTVKCHMFCVSLAKCHTCSVSHFITCLCHWHNVICSLCHL